ncbi:MAG: glycosyltransferase family 4 protein [Gemmatimonadaceae bacterium]|nr:glycosyltransferase family 4 protein [Gemmatimonadaceae bacterium]
MRHLFVTQDYPPDLGGMARRHVELCRRLAPDEVVVSTVAASGAEAFDRGEAYRIRREPFPFREAKRLTRQVAWSAGIAHEAAGGRTIIHLGNIRPCGYAVQLATRRVRVPYLVYVNGGDLLREQQKVGRALSLKRWSARDIFARSSGVVANSAWSADLARRVMQLAGVRHAPEVAAIDLGTDPLQFAPSRDRGLLRRRLGIGDAPLLVTVARLVPHKGQDTVVEALASLGPTVRYLIVGDGADRERLERIANARQVAHRLHFSGPLSDEEVAEAYATATVYVGLSRLDNGINVEGFGISFVEASASGVPVVAGDSGGVRSAVRHDETGFVIPSGDAASAAAAIARLIDDAGLRGRMGAAGRRAVETHYNWDRVARETRAFAHRVTGIAT